MDVKAIATDLASAAESRWPGLGKWLVWAFLGILVGALSSWLALIIFRTFVIFSLFSQFSEWLSIYLPFDEPAIRLITIAISAFSLPFLAFLSSFILFGSRSLPLLGLVAGVVGLGFILLYLLGEGMNFTRGGDPLRCWAMTPAGIQVVSRSPGSPDCGRDPTYNIPFAPITPEIAPSIMAAKNGDRPEPLELERIGENGFFDPGTGLPKVWFSHDGLGGYRFFTGAGFDPYSQQPLRPADRENVLKIQQFVKRELDARKEAQKKKVAEKERAAAERAAAIESRKRAEEAERQRLAEQARIKAEKEREAQRMAEERQIRMEAQQRETQRMAEERRVIMEAQQRETQRMAEERRMRMEAKRREEERVQAETRWRAKQLAMAKSQVNAGNFLGARFSLQSLLERDPSNVEAEQLIRSRTIQAACQRCGEIVEINKEKNDLTSWPRWVYSVRLKMDDGQLDVFRVAKEPELVAGQRAVVALEDGKVRINPLP